MIGWRAVVATACTALLAACATPSRDGVTVPGENLSGRLAVRVDAAAGAAERSMSAGFELQGQARAGRLNLTTPLGTMLAQARWAPGQVLLVTPQGERAYSTLDELTRDVLGESVPVAALFDWLNGRPWPDAPSTRTATASGPGFRQLGWVIDLARFDEASIAAVREQPPVVTVRVKLDRP